MIIEEALRTLQEKNNTQELNYKGQIETLQSVIEQLRGSVQTLTDKLSMYELQLQNKESKINQTNKHLTEELEKTLEVKMKQLEETNKKVRKYIKKQKISKIQGRNMTNRHCE